MKQKMVRLIRGLWSPLCGAAGMLPLSYWVFARFVPELLGMAWVFPVLFGIVMIAALQIPSRWVRVTVALGSVTFFAAAVFLMPGQFKLSILVTAMGTTVMLLIRMVESGTSLFSSLCMALHILVQLQITANRISGKTTFEPIATVVTGAFFVFMLLSLLTMNRENLQDITMGKHKVPGSMKKKQRRFTLILYVGAFLLMMIPALAQGIQSFFQWLLGLLLTVLGWLTKLLAGETSEDPPVSMDNMQGTFAEAGSTAISHNFEDILIVILMVALAVAVIWFLIRFSRHLFRFLQKLWGKLGNTHGEETQTYEDEVTSTRENVLKNWVRSWAERNRILSVDERTLDPGKRIRYHYLRLLMKHSNWKSGKTARETLPEEAAELYEKARYSTHPISEAEAGKFAAEIKRL